MPEIEPSYFRTEREHQVTTVTIACRLTRAMKRLADYALVPFDVAPETSRLEVQYEYAGQQEPLSGNEIDLGLVDPRGPEFPQFLGFRGWSGNARRCAALSEQAATPGYLPGPIRPGGWWALLGLYKLDPEGVEVRLTIRMLPTAGAVPAPPAPPGPAPASEAPATETRWFAGDLHSHTHHSDAPGSVAELATAARQRGLEFLAVTDHNTTSHFPFLAAQEGPTLLPGEEVTSYHGHMNVWGNARLIDFRVRDVSELRSVIDAAHAQGAIVSASHPTISGMDWGFGYDLPLDCIEVWHGRAGVLNSASLAIWERLLAAGRAVVAVGGSDVHIGKPGTAPGEPTTWIRARSVSPVHVLDALRAGRVVINTRQGPWVELEASDGTNRFGVGDIAPAGPMRLRCLVERGVGCGLRLLSAHRELAAAPVDESPFELELHLDLSRDRFVRAELSRPGASIIPAFPLVAMTNPIWCR